MFYNRSEIAGDDNETIKNNKIKCHYEILSIERNVDTSAIKKAWRTAALKWHPDKNNNSEASTHQFRLIQEAYECLSDPVERKWYDEHREGILQGYDSSISNISFLFNVMPFQHSGCYTGYNNTADDTGFYQVYNHVFQSIIGGETRGWASENAKDDMEQIPIAYLLKTHFGTTSSEWTEVSAFYAAWESFSSCLTYAWVDIYDTRRESADGTTRQIRRLMEEDNRKARRNAKRERNEDITNLIRFVKKRDVRVQKQRLKVEKQQREREEHKRTFEENKKKSIQGAKEAWLIQSKHAAAALEAEDLNAGRIRLADLDDHDDFYKGRGKKKKRGKKNKGRDDEYSAAETNSTHNGYYWEPEELVVPSPGVVVEKQQEQHHGEGGVIEIAPFEEYASITTNHETMDSNTNENSPKVGEVSNNASAEESEEEEPAEWRCECCRKDFKSRGQLNNHMKSKKHNESWATYEKVMEQMDDSFSDDDDSVEINTHNMYYAETEKLVEEQHHGGVIASKRSIHMDDNPEETSSSSSSLEVQSVALEDASITATHGTMDSNTNNNVSVKVEDASNNACVEESEEEEPDEWRCECCRKDFKSRGQMDNHMKSKKHKESRAKYEKIVAQMEDSSDDDST